jgi:hypothetical protein
MRELLRAAARGFRFDDRNRAFRLLGELRGGGPALGQIFPGGLRCAIEGGARHARAFGGVAAEFGGGNHGVSPSGFHIWLR